MYIVSSCLLGIECKYSGGHNLNPEIIEFLKDKKFVKVCPESFGGLPIPRPPSERRGERVVSKEGKDVTAEFELGARKSLEVALKASEKAGEPIEAAILMSRSPSCGCGLIYDGTFSGTLVPGRGVTAELFINNGIRVVTPDSLDELAEHTSDITRREND